MYFSPVPGDQVAGEAGSRTKARACGGCGDLVRTPSLSPASRESATGVCSRGCRGGLACCPPLSWLCNGRKVGFSVLGAIARKLGGCQDSGAHASPSGSQGRRGEGELLGVE